MGDEVPRVRANTGLYRRLAGLAVALLVALAGGTAAQANPADGFVGTWDSYTNVQPFPHFALNLTATGPASIHGTYQPQPTDPLGQVDGTVDPSGKTLTYTWSLGTLAGTGTFVLSGNQINGTWQTYPPNSVSGTWNGARAGTAGGVSVSGGGITFTLPGGVGITFPLPPGAAGTSTGPAPSPTPTPSPTPVVVPPGLPTTTVVSAANVRAAGNKTGAIITTIGAGSVVAYEPACPGGYCRIYFQDTTGTNQTGYVYKTLLGLGGTSASSGGSSSGTAPGVADFSGSWSLAVDAPGQPTETYQLQITQSGASATGSLTSTPPSTFNCTVAGNQMSCSWIVSGTTVDGDLTLSGTTMSGTWYIDGSPPASGGSWQGTHL